MKASTSRREVGGEGFAFELCENERGREAVFIFIFIKLKQIILVMWKFFEVPKLMLQNMWSQPMASLFVACMY